MRVFGIICALAVILVLWRMNIFAWPWHIVFQWSGGLAAIVVVGVTLNALRREHSKDRRAADDDGIMMFLAVLATSVLTLSALLNFILFIVFEVGLDSSNPGGSRP